MYNVTCTNCGKIFKNPVSSECTAATFCSISCSVDYNENSDMQERIKTHMTRVAEVKETITINIGRLMKTAKTEKERNGVKLFGRCVLHKFTGQDISKVEDKHITVEALATLFRNWVKANIAAKKKKL